MIKEYRQICDLCGSWFEVYVDEHNIDLDKVRRICNHCRSQHCSTEDDELYNEQYWKER